MNLPSFRYSFRTTLGIAAMAAITGCAGHQEQTALPIQNDTTKMQLSKGPPGSVPVQEIWVGITFSNLPHAGIGGANGDDTIRLRVPKDDMANTILLDPINSPQKIEDGQTYLLRYDVSNFSRFYYPQSHEPDPDNNSGNILLVSKGGDAYLPYAVTVAFKIAGDPNPRFMYVGRWRDDLWICGHSTDPWIIQRSSPERDIWTSLYKAINAPEFSR